MTKPYIYWTVYYREWVTTHGFDGRPNGIPPLAERLAITSRQQYHKYYPSQITNLETGEVIYCTLPEGQQIIAAAMSWPSRDEALKKLEQWRKWKACQVTLQRASILPELRSKEKEWTRKSKLAETKLATIRRKIRYYEKHQSTQTKSQVVA